MEAVDLKYPVKLATGETVARLELSRPRVRDLKRAQEQGSGEAAQELVLLSAIVSPAMTPEDLEELDLADYRRLSGCLRGMLAED